MESSPGIGLPGRVPYTSFYISPGPRSLGSVGQRVVSGMAVGACGDISPA